MSVVIPMKQFPDDRLRHMNRVKSEFPNSGNDCHDPKVLSSLRSNVGAGFRIEMAGRFSDCRKVDYL